MPPRRRVGGGGTNSSGASCRDRGGRVAIPQKNMSAMRIADVVPPKYRCVFKFEFFNRMQAEAFEVTYNGGNSIVLAAPTGCGKTVIMELALIKLLGKKGSKAKVPPLLAPFFPSLSLSLSLSLFLWII